MLLITMIMMMNIYGLWAHASERDAWQSGHHSIKAFCLLVNFYMNDHLLARLSNELHLNKCVRINAQFVKD